MATGGANEDLKRELTCPICLDYFKEPVMLNCGHNFCRVCICMHWDESGDHFEGYECPQCRAVFNKASFTKNFLAQNLVDKLDVLQCLGSGPGPHKPVKVDSKCEKHGEELKLYCHTDKRPICVVCRESRVHRHHQVAPLSEIVNDMKGELESRLEVLRWHKAQCIKVRTADERTKSDARQRKRRLREKIEADVGVLVQFLLDERDSLLESLDADERGAVAAMDDNLEVVQAELAAVDKEIADINAHLASKTNFEKLTKTYDEVLRARAKPLTTPVAAESATGWSDFPEPFQLIIWKKMMHVLHTMPQNLTMDPDTAHPNLFITDFDTKVEEGHIRLNDLPDLPERFNRFGGVLATAHYSGGQHYWEVDVKDKGVWYLGVTSEYSNRKGFVSLSPGTGYWSLCLQDRLYANEEDGRVPVADYWNSPRVGVYLDYDNGRVSFYDAVTMKKLFVFDTCFDEPVYPFFSPGKNDPGSRLQICHYY